MSLQAQYSAEDAKEVVDCLIFLGYSGESVTQPNSVVGSFSDLLEKKLTLESYERDVVLMHHDIVGDFGDREEHHTSTLTCYGTEDMTAMCKTVGYTAAVGTEMVLDNKTILQVRGGEPQLNGCGESAEIPFTTCTLMTQTDTNIELSERHYFTHGEKHIRKGSRVARKGRIGVRGRLQSGRKG